jgi:hypothetical protein
LTGSYSLTSCRAIFEARTFQRYVSWWPSAAVIRKTSVKAYNHYFLVSEDEPDQAPGAFHKYAPNDPWVSLPQGAYYDSNGVYHNWDGTVLTVIVPQIGYIRIVHQWPQAIDVYLDRTTCSAANRPNKGICDTRTPADLIPRNIDFNDDTLGSDPEDPRVPLNVTADPCQGDAALIAAMNKVCLKLHPAGPGNSQYEACKFDVCVTGDPDTPIVGGADPSCVLNDWLNSHPATRARNASVSVSQGTTCEPCPNYCSFHGSCNTASSTCVCEAGWTGRDCGLPVGFDCYTLTSDSALNSINRNVQPLVALTGQVDLNQFLAPYTVEDSVLIYPLSQRSSANWDANAALSLVVTAGSVNSKGSVTVTLNFQQSVAAFEALVARPNGVSAANADATVSKNGNVITVTLSWNFSPISVRISKLSAIYNLIATLSNPVGVSQLLVGSGVEGRTQMDVIRVGVADTVRLNANQCQSSPCDTLDSCEACAANSQCGFCVESGRCMRGDSFGPLRGTCANWRFSFDERISRRVTSQFGFPVNPVKAEVYLTTAVGSDNPDRELPVDLSVSAVDLGNVWDVLLMVSPRTSQTSSSGITAFNTKVRSALETSLLPSLLDARQYPELGLAISTYGDSVRLARDFTEVREDTLYLFGQPIQTISNMASEANDRQVSALAGIVPAGGASPKWRRNVRRLTIMTVEGTRASFSQASVNSMRAALIQHRIFPVLLINRGNCDSTCQAGWKSWIADSTNGVGFGFTLTFDADYNEFAATVRKAIRLATGQISLTYDRANSGHINTARTGLISESLQVFGLTRNFRGRFAVPFKRFASTDSSTLTATITAVGFGQATVEDIVSERPTASDIRRDTLQDQTDSYFLIGRTFKNLLQTRPMIQTLPAGASLYDTNIDGSMGTKITADLLPYTVTHPSARVWFVPEQYKHSARDTAGNLFPYASYTYTVHDGCAASAVATVVHYISNVNDPPSVTGVRPGELITPEDTDLPFQVTLDDPDYEPKDNLKVIFSRLPENCRILFQGASVVIGTAYPYDDRTYPFTLRPNGDWWGSDSFRVIVRDDGTPVLERTATVAVSVTPTNDAPNAISSLQWVETPERVVAKIPLAGDDKDRVYGDRANATIYIRINLPGDFKGTLCRVNSTGESCATGDVIADGAMVPIDLTAAPITAKVFFAPLPGATEYSCAFFTFPGTNCSTTYTQFSWTVVDSRGATSNTVQVPIYVLQLANPPVVPEDATYHTKENQTVSFTLTGENLEYPGELLTFQIESFPEHITLKRQDGSVINAASPLVSGSAPTVFATPDPHLHGRPEANWLFGGLTFTGKDRYTKSNIGSINITVEAVNDPPVPTFFNATTLEKQPIFFDLEASDIDSDVSQLTFKVISSVDPTKGQLFLVDVAAQDQRGAEITQASLPFTVPKVNYNGTLSNWLVYIPSGYDGYWFGQDGFTYTVTDVDTFGNSVVNTVSQPVKIVVEPVNDSPIVNVQPFYTFEDELSIITLAGEDPWFGENDPLQAVILRFYTPADSNGCRNKMGKLYQFSGSVANPKGAEIDLDNLPAVVSDSQFRVIYEPFPNANNDVKVPHLFVEPVIDYKVVETDSAASPKFLQSAFQSIPIVISPRNDLPVVLGPQNNQIEACTDVCTYKKNFGRSFRETLGFSGIFFGGDDIEKGTLTPVIVAVRALTNNFVLQTMDTQRRILPADVKPNDASTWISLDSRFIDLVPPTGCNTTSPVPPFIQGLEFQPGLDEHGDKYVEIDYRVRDDQDGLSADIKTITINVENTQLPPRADQFNQYVTAFQNSARDFTIRAVDPDGDAFQMVVASCSGERGGKFQLLQADGSVDASAPVINCPTTSRAVFSAVPKGADNYQTWSVRYTPPTNKVGQNINILTLTYDDAKSTSGLLDTYYVITDVQKENRAPVIRLNGIVVEGQAEPVTQTGQVVAPLSVIFSDPDIPASFQSTPIAVTLTINNGGKFLLGDQVIEGNNITLDQPLPSINTLLASLRVNASSGFVSYTVDIVANDKGNFGFCKSATGEPAPCALETRASVNVEFYESPSSVNSVAVGSASAAAAAAAIIAAALIFRKINRAPEDAYRPWDLDSADDQGVVLNPLFETNTTEGENPLFEAPGQEQ